MSGFSLIELLFVLLIIAVLAAITVPNYSDYIHRARRSERQTALLDLACRMERYYSKHNTYRTATIGTGRSSDVLSQATLAEQHYHLSITDASDSTYTLQASDLKDKKCPKIILTSDGTSNSTSCYDK